MKHYPTYILMVLGMFTIFVANSNADKIIQPFQMFDIDDKTTVKITVEDFVFTGNGKINESTKIGYFPARDQQAGPFLAVLDMETFQLLASIQLENEPLHVLISEKENKIYVLSYPYDRLITIDGNTNKISDTFLAPNGDFGGIIPIGNSSDRLYVVDDSNYDRRFDVYDLKTKKKIHSFKQINRAFTERHNAFIVDAERNLIYTFYFDKNQTLVSDGLGKTIDTFSWPTTSNAEPNQFVLDSLENKIYFHYTVPDPTSMVDYRYDDSGPMPTRYLKKIAIYDLTLKTHLETLDITNLYDSDSLSSVEVNHLELVNTNGQILFRGQDSLLVYDQKTGMAQKIVVKPNIPTSFAFTKEDLIYSTSGKELRVVSINKSTPSAIKEISISKNNQPVCGKGTHLENNQCIPDKSKTQPLNFHTGLKKGQWVKYQISHIGIDVNSPLVSSEAIRQSFISSFVSKDGTNSYLNSEWLKVRVDNVLGSEITYTSSIGLTDGSGEKILGTQTLQASDVWPLIIPTDLRIGDKITFIDDEFSVKEEVRTMVGGKQVDAIRLVSNQVQLDDGFIGELNLEGLYHKQSGMLLMMDTTAHGSGVGNSYKFSFGLHAIEISDNFLESTLSNGGGCLIATATYGTELAPQVQSLREIRDRVLFSTDSGTVFIAGFNEFYYSFSPTVADLERQNIIFKELVRYAITPMLSTISILRYVDINSESEMLGYGIGVILLNVGMYVITPILIIRASKSRVIKHIRRK